MRHSAPLVGRDSTGPQRPSPRTPGAPKRTGWWSLGTANSEDPWTEGDSDWNHLNQWGGFSSDGFHSVIIFPELSPPADMQQSKVTVMQWAPVTPDAGLDQEHNPGSQLSLLLPWRTAYLEEPRPDVRAGQREQTWLGRKLIVEDLEVGIGHIRLTGLIFPPQGEQSRHSSPLCTWATRH